MAKDTLGDIFAHPMRLFYCILFVEHGNPIGLPNTHRAVCDLMATTGAFKFSASLVPNLFENNIYLYIFISKEISA